MAYLENIPYNKIHVKQYNVRSLRDISKFSHDALFFAIAWSIQKGLSLIFPVQTSLSVDNYF